MGAHSVVLELLQIPYEKVRACEQHGSSFYGARAATNTVK